MKAVHEHKIYVDAEHVRKAVIEYLKALRDDLPDDEKIIEVLDSDGLGVCQELTVVWTEREPRQSRAPSDDISNTGSTVNED
jgi:hypothetical protein